MNIEHLPLVCQLTIFYSNLTNTFIHTCEHMHNAHIGIYVRTIITNLPKFHIAIQQMTTQLAIYM